MTASTSAACAAFIRSIAVARRRPGVCMRPPALIERPGEPPVAVTALEERPAAFRASLGTVSATAPNVSAEECWPRHYQPTSEKAYDCFVPGRALSDVPVAWCRLEAGGRLSGRRVPHRPGCRRYR